MKGTMTSTMTPTMKPAMNPTMKSMMKSLLLAAVLLLTAVPSLRAQGYGFYIGSQYIQLSEGDKVTFTESADQSEAPEEGFVTDIKVETSEGEITVYQATEIVFQGDIERYFQAMPSWFNQYGSNYGHYAFGYGSMMHIRDVMTAEMARSGNSGYNWFINWMRSTNLGPAYLYSNYVTEYYEDGITVANALIEALAPVTKYTDDQQAYLSTAYAFRALNYLEMAQMYEYLPNNATASRTFGGHDVTGLTVPIVKEGETFAESHPRATRDEMAAFILSDLDKAAAHIGDYTRKSKVVPDLYCVYGLYARCYMWLGEYAKAAEYAGKVIDGSGLRPAWATEIVLPADAFNNLAEQNWMWGAQPKDYDDVVNSGLVNWPSWMCNEMDGYAPYVPLVINPELIDKMGAGDARRGQFKLTGNEEHVVGYLFGDLPTYSSLKFRPYQGSDDSFVAAQAAYPVMRIEEMYLIRAEALMRSGQMAEGKDLLQRFVKEYRDPDFALPAGKTNDEYLDICFDQKRMELWGEGQIFFDYKRLDKSVNRCSDPSDSLAVNIWNANEQLCTVGRPAWMNFVFGSRSVNKNAALQGYNNPDPSGLYVAGTSALVDMQELGDGYVTMPIVEQLINEGMAAYFYSCSYSTSRDMTTLNVAIDGDNLVVEVKDGAVTIPEQTLYSLSPDSLMTLTVKAEGGVMEDGTITFTSDGITLKYGNQTVAPTVARRKGITFYLPEKTFSASIGMTLSRMADADHPYSVIEKNGRSWLHVYMSASTSQKAYLGAVATGVLSDEDYTPDYSAEYIDLGEYRKEGEGCPFTLTSDGATGTYTVWQGGGTQASGAWEGGYVDIPIEGTITPEQEQDIEVFAAFEVDGAIFKMRKVTFVYPEYSNSPSNIMLLDNGDDYYVEKYGTLRDLESDDDAFVSVIQCFGADVEAAYAFVVPQEMSAAEAQQAYEAKAYPMVSFALTHSREASVAYRIPVTERGTQKVAIVALSGGKVRRVAFSSTFDYKIWKSLGMGTFADNFLGTGECEVEIMQSMSDPNRFRLVNPYGEAYSAQEWYGGEAPEDLYFTVSRADGDSLAVDGMVTFDDCCTGYYMDLYDATIYLLHPSRFGLSDADCMYSCVDRWQDDGTPGVVKLAPYYYMWGVGGWNQTKTQNVTIVFPGVDLNADWAPYAIGAYKYTVLFGTEEEPTYDEGLTLYRNNTDYNRYKIENIFYGVDFVFTVDSVGCLYFDKQSVGYDHPNYGPVYVQQASSSMGGTCRFNASYTFDVNYVCSAGSFGLGEETFTITSLCNSAAAAPTRRQPAARKSLWQTHPKWEMPLDVPTPPVDGVKE